VKVIIAGSRGVPEQVRQCKAAVIDFEQRYGRITEVVSGCARGADRVGELFAEMRQIPVDKYPADWNTHGKRAGIIRNSQMANVAQGLVALWDEQSPGTRNMIETARNKKLHIVVWNYLTNKKVVLS
jgi:YspA, cpYpsA-related SLOG family